MEPHNPDDQPGDQYSYQPYGQPPGQPNAGYPMPGAAPAPVVRRVFWGLPVKGWAAIAAGLVALILVGVALNAAADGTTPTAEGTFSDSPTDTGTDDTWSDAETTEAELPDPVAEAVVGDCFFDYGTDEYTADIEPTYCGSGTFEVVDIVEGSTDLASCDSVDNANKAVTSTDAYRVLCLGYIAIDGDDAYHAQVDECVYGPNEEGSAWGTTDCTEGAFRVLERLEGESDMGLCTESTYYNHAISYTTGESYLDVVLCLQMIYPGGDIGYAELDNCMSMTDDYEYFEFVSDCSDGNVYLTGLTYEDVDAESWCNGWGWYQSGESEEFPEHTFTACWGWL